METLKGLIAFVICSCAAIFFISAIAALISLPILVLKAKSCGTRSDGIGRHKYSIISGCLVEPKGHEGFIPLESYKFIDGVTQE